MDQKEQHLMSPESKSPLNCVLDTNVYRGTKIEDGKAIIERNGWVTHLSPLNALEILGFDESAEDFAEDFGARKSAALKMLEWNRTDDGIRWVLDPECFNAELLGCKVRGYEYGHFEEALRRLSVASSYESLQLNAPAARKAREAAYEQFVSKIADLLEAFKKHAVSVKSANGASLRSESELMPFLLRQGIYERTLRAELTRIEEIVSTYRADKSFSSVIDGSIDYRRAQDLLPYVDLYVAYVYFCLRNDRQADKNDFGDLQFGIYAAGGLTLVTNEKNWHTIGAMTTYPSRFVRGC